MRRIAEGDVDALRALLDRHWPGLVRYARRMLGSPDEAQDVAQEVFVRVWEHRARWDPGGSVQTYLYQIARNLALLRLRHLDVRDRAEPEIRHRASRPPTPEEHAEGADLREAFEAAVGSLPERRREAFVLVRLRGLTLRETAEVMGVSRRTVANHVYLAVTDLEEALRPFLC